jgi:cellulose synthase/poly-beta-1,6-N-acetylglucosamine synthase-like glycosyltransferase
MRAARNFAMMATAEVILWLFVAGLLVPMAVVVAESIAALLPPRSRSVNGSTARSRCAVLVPAHDEELGIGRTLTALRPQLEPDDRLIVVADNCTDGTAETARSFGATVVERSDPDRRGKGFALDFGIRFLDPAPPEVLVIIDADCVVQDGAIERLARAVAGNGRPAQAIYLLDKPPGATAKQQLSAFAFQYKNLVRPLGLNRLGLPCLLTGTGMAFPWAVIREANLASANLVEDMRLGVDLAVAGRPPNLCPEAQVQGELPAGRRASVTQRRRWEYGHLQTLLTQVPRLLVAAVRQRRLDLLGLALELSVPPLSMLFLLWAAGVTGLACWCLGGGSLWPAVVLASTGAAVVLAIAAAWLKYGREALPFTALLAVPFYLVWKIPLYLSFIWRGEREWKRTERDVAPVREEKAGL